MTTKPIPSPEPTTDPIEQECQRLLAELEDDIAETGVGSAAYAWDMADLLHEVERPCPGSSNAALAEYTRCFRPDVCPGQFPAPPKDSDIP
jgi:hypothetical protein